jgi:hypothetical protein
MHNVILYFFSQFKSFIGTSSYFTLRFFLRRRRYVPRRHFPSPRCCPHRPDTRHVFAVVFKSVLVLIVAILFPQTPQGPVRLQARDAVFVVFWTLGRIDVRCVFVVVFQVCFTILDVVIFYTQTVRKNPYPHALRGTVGVRFWLVVDWAAHWNAILFPVVLVGRSDDRLNVFKKSPLLGVEQRREQKFKSSKSVAHNVIFLLLWMWYFNFRH